MVDNYELRRQIKRNKRPFRYTYVFFVDSTRIFFPAGNVYFSPYIKEIRTSRKVKNTLTLRY